MKHALAIARFRADPETVVVVRLSYEPPAAVDRARYVDTVVRGLATDFATHALRIGVTTSTAPSAVLKTVPGDGGPPWSERLLVQASWLAVPSITATVLGVFRETDGAPVTTRPPVPDYDTELHVTYELLRQRLVNLCSEVLGHSGDGEGRGLAWQVAYLERWLPQTIREKCERAAAVALDAKRVASLQDTIEVLREQLASEVRSSQAASAIADELSVALEKSREQVTGLEARLAEVQRKHDNIMAIRIEEVDASLKAELDRRVAAGQVAYGAAATLGSARIQELEATLAAKRQQHARDVDDLRDRDRMADPEGMSYATRVKDAGVYPGAK